MKKLLSGMLKSFFSDKVMEKAKEDYKKAAKKLDAAIKENERMEKYYYAKEKDKKEKAEKQRRKKLEKLSRISLNSII